MATPTVTVTFASDSDLDFLKIRANGEITVRCYDEAGAEVDWITVQPGSRAVIDAAVALVDVEDDPEAWSYGIAADLRDAVVALDALPKEPTDG